MLVSSGSTCYTRISNQGNPADQGRLARMMEWIGRIFGRFEILGELHRDELGIVYHARDLVSEREVSLRVLHRHLSESDPSLRQRLSRGIGKLVSFVHPNVSRLYGMDEMQRYICLVSAYVPGRKLSEILAKEPLEPERVYSIVADLASALDEAHRQGIVHGDLSAASVTISAQGKAILDDLGLAMLIASPTAGAERRVRAVPDAPMPPEVQQGHIPTPGSDRYALAALLHEMLTGRPPATVPAQKGESVSSLASSLPAPFDAVLSKALAADPSARYATAAAMVAELPRPRAKRAPWQLTPSARLWGIAAVAFLLCVAALLALPTLMRRDRVVEKPQPLAQDAVSAAALLGTYEITVPRRIRLGESATVRLAVHLPVGISAADLPESPTPVLPAQSEQALLGYLDLCRYVWGQLDAPGLEIAGPHAMRRMLQSSGAEWLWSVRCPPEGLSPGEHQLSIRMFARDLEPDGSSHDVLLKEITFTITVENRASHTPPAIWGALIALATAIALAIYLWLHRPQSPGDTNGTGPTSPRL